MYDSLPIELERKLLGCTNLPSLPGYAVRILEIAQNPEIDIEEAAKVICLDPAISAKLLRMANSALYANRRRVATLQVAILTMGLQATLSLALSFSLVQSFRGEKPQALNHGIFWRRAGLAAAASGVIGTYCGCRDTEELLTAALLQDIGMLSLDQVCPDLYSQLDLDQTLHHCICDEEKRQMDLDHAVVGGSLLAHWNFPDRFHRAVSSSHDPDSYSTGSEANHFNRMVAFSGVIADLYINRSSDNSFQEAAEKAERWLHISPAKIPEFLKPMNIHVSEIESIYQISICSGQELEQILQEARDLLVLNALHVCRENETLKTNTVALESSYEGLERKSQQDGLTGVFNRGTLDEELERVFHQAVRTEESLSIGLIDIDHFKSVNDRYGHPVGDKILSAVSQILKAQTRKTDMVGRYGGEEFLVILPGVNGSLAEMIFQRMLEGVRMANHDIGKDKLLQVTISIGIATRTKNNEFSDVPSLVQAADQALYHAKESGRNSCVSFEHLAGIG